jgi:hypothetical protein
VTEIGAAIAEALEFTMETLNDFKDGPPSAAS